MFARQLHIIFALVFVAGSDLGLQPNAIFPGFAASPVMAQATNSVQNDEQAYSNGLSALKSGDPQTAQAIWTDLALKGSAKAQYSLALLLETGQPPVQPNLKQSIRFYSMAADAGIAEAQTNLGLLYAQGRGVNANPALAVKYWKKSASAGHAMALFNLGLAYYQGTGIAPDSEEAVALIYRAAMQNLKEAQYALGQFYRNGVGIAKSDEEALYWYRIAGRQGHLDAEKAGQELKAQGVKFRGAPDPAFKPREAAVFSVANAGVETRSPAEEKLQQMVAPDNVQTAESQQMAQPAQLETLPDLPPEDGQDSAGMTITIEEAAPVLPPLNEEVTTLPKFENPLNTDTNLANNQTAPRPTLTRTTRNQSQILMLSASEAEIVYREALILMQNHDGDRISNGQMAADKILAAAMAGNARAQRSLGEMYLLGVDIRRNEQQSLYWLREAERNGIDDINGFADALELLGYSEPVKPNANPQFTTQ